MSSSPKPAPEMLAVAAAVPRCSAGDQASDAHTPLTAPEAAEGAFPAGQGDGQPQQDACIQLRYDMPRALSLIAAGLFVTLASVAMALGYIPVKWGSFALALASFSALFFGVGTAILALRVFQRGPVVEVSPQGLRDRRISPKLISWHDVAAITTTKVDRQRFVIFMLTRAGEQRLAIHPVQRLVSWATGPRKWDGHAIGTTGLDRSFDDLVIAINKALVASGRVPPE